MDYQNMKYFYQSPTHSTQDRISYRQNNKDLLFKIGDEFEKYDFTQKPLSFKEAIENRLVKLKETGKYLRFWFSGGKDSRLILDSAIRMNIKFDEIVIVRHRLLGPDYVLGPWVEIQANAVDYISEIKSLLPDTKITIFDFLDDDFNLVFGSPDWIHHTPTWYINTAMEQQVFYKYVNPIKNFVEDIADRIDIVGSTNPHVYWNNGWKFVYVDLQFSQSMYSTCENFLTSPSYPEIAHAYASAIQHQLENLNLQPSRFEEYDRISPGNQRLRSIRALLPEYQFEIHKPSAEWPKVFMDPWRPTNDYFWRVNESYKSFLNCLMCYYSGGKSKAFNSYTTLTDWDTVKKEIDFGGILSKEFDLS